MFSFIIGKAHNPYDPKIFHNIALVAFLAWVGFGSDGITSSCYGPQEAFFALGAHTHLSIFVALATAITIFLISASYSQVIEAFPYGGGGYLVASKLLSPNTGMISGCALIIDYVLTITVSVASGADAIFSFLPQSFHIYKLEFAMLALICLIIFNLRGAKESVKPLIPIFLVFIATHVFVIIYSLISNANAFPALYETTKTDVATSYSQIGLFGIFFIIMRAYSMGAGTFTGIEAVSNGMPLIREPKVKNAKKAMVYMSLSLAFMVVGLMLTYLFYNVQPEFGKTYNAIAFEHLTASWGAGGKLFVLITLFSEAALLFVAAQTGFLGGPRVLANMALDRWFPTRFTALSDRFVNKNGVLIMGIAALAIMLLAQGSVKFLVVLYSINVFITFTLTQLGMVKHWWIERKKQPRWKKKILINGLGLLLTSTILIVMLIIKFYDGGWITLLVTGALVIFAFTIKTHYFKTAKLLHRLNTLITAANINSITDKNDDGLIENPKSEFDPNAKTAILLVNGYNGLGLHTLFGVIRLFDNSFKNFIFVQVGIINSGNYKGAQEVDNLEIKIKEDINHYVNYIRKSGRHADGIALIGTDVLDEIEQLAPRIMEKFPNAVFFGGQLVFPEDTFITRWLHNYTVFALQRKFYSKGIPFILLPIRV
ncbi:MAG: APC family permease [Endomicrobiales bacterium]|nr:APC family permease [Endomicrobiales bacterium]